MPKNIKNISEVISDLSSIANALDDVGKVKTSNVIDSAANYLTKNAQFYPGLPYTNPLDATMGMSQVGMIPQPQIDLNALYQEVVTLDQQFRMAVDEFQQLTGKPYVSKFQIPSNFTAPVFGNNTTNEPLGPGAMVGPTNPERAEKNRRQQNALSSVLNINDYNQVMHALRNPSSLSNEEIQRLRRQKLALESARVGTSNPSDILSGVEATKEIKTPPPGTPPINWKRSSAQNEMQKLAEVVTDLDSIAKALNEKGKTKTADVIMAASTRMKKSAQVLNVPRPPTPIGETIGQGVSSILKLPWQIGQGVLKGMSRKPSQTTGGSPQLGPKEQQDMMLYNQVQQIDSEFKQALIAFQQTAKQPYVSPYGPLPGAPVAPSAMTMTERKQQPLLSNIPNAPKAPGIGLKDFGIGGIGSIPWLLRKF